MSSKYQQRNNGMVCRTIDSLLGKFCYNCGAKDDLLEVSLDGFGVCMCDQCVVAKADDDNKIASADGGPPTEQEWTELCVRLQFVHLDRQLRRLRAGL